MEKVSIKFIDAFLITSKEKDICQRGEVKKNNKTLNEEISILC